MALESIVKKLFATDSVSEDLWTLTYTFGAGGTLIAVLSFIGTFMTDGFTWWIMLALMILGAAFGLLGAFMYDKGQKKVPSATPPQIGILTIWGERQEIILSEGDKMTFPWWPLRIDFQLVPRVQKNFDWAYTDVRCKAPVNTLGGKGDPDTTTITGGAVTVNVSATLGPDINNPKNVINFLNRGGLDGAAKIFQDVLGEGIRHISILYEWEEFISLKAELVVALIVKTTDADFHLLKRNSDGTIDPAILKITPEDYKKLPNIVDPYDYFFHIPSADEAAKEVAGMSKEQLHTHEAAKKKCRTQEIEVFLRVARENGVSDIIDLGLIVSRITIPHINPEGNLEEAADEASVEKKEREKEDWDFDTELMLAQKYIDFAKKNGVTVELKDALEYVRTNRGRNTEIIVRSGGNPLVDAAALINQAQGK